MGIKITGIKLSDLKKQEHEKYGISYILDGATVELEGQLFKINTFKETTEEEVTDSAGNKRKIKDWRTKVAFRPVEASVPKDVTAKAKAEAKTFKTSEVAKTPAAEDEDFKLFLKFKAMMAAGK
jgi:hypothetical protein